MKVFFIWGLVMIAIGLCSVIGILAHRIEVIEAAQTARCQKIFEAKKFDDPYWRDFCQVGTNR